MVLVLSSFDLPRGRDLAPDDVAAMPWANAHWETRDGALWITPDGTPFTLADLHDLPDNGWRHELLDGAIVMSAAPGRRHQRVVYRLWAELDDVRPPHLEVIGAPFEVVLGPTGPDGAVEAPQPDLLVAPHAAFTDTNLPVPPLLAVEVLSPSNRRTDLGPKKDSYERAGVAHYWVIDPDQPDGPRLLAWTLHDGTYSLVADVTGDEVFRTDLPFPVAFTVTDLLD